MPYASSTDGYRLHYRDVPARPSDQHVAPARPSDHLPVLMIHGLGMSSRFWFDLPERIASDPTRPRRVLAIDNRGTGQSDRPRGRYHMRQLARDAISVLDAAGIDRAIVVGVSMGGMISQNVAIDHPTRVGGLVLVATSPGMPVAQLPHPMALFTLLTAPLRKKIDPRIDRLLLSRKDVARAREIFVEWLQLHEQDPPDAKTFLSHFSAVLLHSTGSRLKQLRCPVHIITGDDDILVRPDNSRRIHARIPHATLEILPDVGHAVPLVDREVVPRALRHASLP
jgi:3-oxoadipate enol-lactonase